LLMSNLIRLQAIGLTVLKIVEFGVLTASMSHLLKRLFRSLLVECNQQQLGDIFACTVQSTKLKTFAHGLQVFMHIVMAHDDGEHQQLINDRIDTLDSLWSDDRTI